MFKKYFEDFLYFFENIYHKIRYHFYYDIKNGILNIIRYGSVIWKTREYDYFYLYILLHKKLSLMLKAFEEDSFHDNTIHIKDMKICIFLLNRLIDDDYFDDDILKEKYGDYETNLYDKKDGKKYFNITRKNIKTDKENEVYIKELKIEINKEEELRKQDLEMLFNILKKKILVWWI